MHKNPYLQAKAPKCAGYRLISLVSIHFPAKFSLHYSDPPLAEYKRGPSNRHLGLYTRALISRYAYDLQTSVRYCLTTPFVFSSFTSLFDSFKHAFRHDWITAFVRTFYYNVTAISSPRCVRSSRQRTSQTRRPSALSCRDERHENFNSKHEREAESE